MAKERNVTACVGIRIGRVSVNAYTWLCGEKLFEGIVDAPVTKAEVLLPEVILNFLLLATFPPLLKNFY